MSLVQEFRGASVGSARETTVHQSCSGDLAIRKGAWKLVMLQNGQRELYNLQTDLRETNDVFAANPEISAKLSDLMQFHIDQGRSTPGVPQKNDYQLYIAGQTGQRDLSQ